MIAGNDPTEQPAALVLGEGMTALGVVRSLSQAGIRVIAAAPKGDVTRLSKWTSNRFWRTHDTPESSRLEHWLLNSRLESAVLMPCSDAWAREVANLSEETTKKYKSWSAEASAIDTLVDKDLFGQKLLEIGLPHPQTFSLSCADDLECIPDSVFDHAFLKPRDSNKFISQFGVKGMFVASGGEARESLAAVQRYNLEVVLQEYIPGPPGNHYFLDGYRERGSGKLRLLARQRLRMYPIDFGNSTDMVTVAVEDIAGAALTLKHLFDNLNYHGIFSAEFKLDDRDNEFKLLEVNCRPWWYVEFADHCGLHACKYAYQEALEQPIESYSGYEVGKRAVFPTHDWHARRLSSSSKSRSLTATIASWLTAYQPFFSWSDPLPAIVGFSKTLSGAVVRRLVRRVN